MADIQKGWSDPPTAIDEVKHRLTIWTEVDGVDGGVYYLGIKDDVRFLIQSHVAIGLLNSFYVEERMRFGPIIQGLRELTGSTQELSRRIEQIILEARRGHV